MFENPEFWRVVGSIGIFGGGVLIIAAVLSCLRDGKECLKAEMEERVRRENLNSVERRNRRL